MPPDKRRLINKLTYQAAGGEITGTDFDINKKCELLFH